MYRLLTEDLLEECAAGKSKDALQRARLRAQADELPEPLRHLRQPRRSYRELPVRVADFARLHRYERGGVVHGLARVRCFSQDDGHIFCAEEEVPAEIEKFLRFFYGVYKAFPFESIDVKLATRPEKRIGIGRALGQGRAGALRGPRACGHEVRAVAGRGGLLRARRSSFT